MNVIMADIRQHRDNALSKILGTIKEAVALNTKDNKKYALHSRSMQFHSMTQEYSERSLSAK
jgi:hypothetical protein